MENATQAVQIVVPAEKQDELIAHLCALGYEGFEQTDVQLIAYIPFHNFDLEELNNLLSNCNLTYSLSTIEKTNWNAVWESNFQPIRIGNDIAVRADFHPPSTGVTHELIITPRMSFGTGHHATTALMLEAMLDIALQNKTVLDFGTGTGILGIFAARLGASSILAIDNDTWCIENAADNCTMNGVQMHLQLAEEPPTNQTFDLVLANINLHIIQANLPALRRCLTDQGILLLSGLLSGDEIAVQESCLAVGLELHSKNEKNGWLSLLYRPVA
jgi:ribosomal protein L11 methyltransferase